jgi:hypothetical protein
MITSYFHQQEMANECAEASDRAHQLDELAQAPGALDHEFWVAVMTEAIETVKGNADPELWPDGAELAIGGGAVIRQAETMPGEDRLVLAITHGAITSTLATVGQYNERTGCYTWVRDWQAYGHQVRAFRRTLRTREAALWAAYRQAQAALPEAVNGRLERALCLVKAGAVQLDGAEATVRSQTRPGHTYHVNGRCNCGDAQNGAPKVNGRPACKHQIACWLERKVAAEVSR